MGGRSGGTCTPSACQPPGLLSLASIHEWAASTVTRDGALVVATRPLGHISKLRWGLGVAIAGMVNLGEGGSVTPARWLHIVEPMSISWYACTLRALSYVMCESCVIPVSI